MHKEYHFESHDFVFSHAFIESPQDFPMHNHDIYEMIFLKKGDISYMIEGKIYQPTKNSLLLTPPLQNHAVLFNSPVPYERYNIVFDERTLNPLAYKKLSSETIIINFDSHPIVTDLFTKMDYYYECFKGDDRKVLLMHLVEEVICNTSLLSQNNEQSDMVYTTNSVIQDTIAYIERNIHTPFHVTTMCNELYISKSHLHHLFMKHLKVTPQKYILSKRLSLAQRELRLGRKATDIYTDCGFTDYSTFFRAYKNHFGHAPSEEININIVRKIQS